MSHPKHKKTLYDRGILSVYSSLKNMYLLEIMRKRFLNVIMEAGLREVRRESHDSQQRK